jgi:formylglycine-generating enzyme required for sulfatase activity
MLMSKCSSAVTIVLVCLGGLLAGQASAEFVVGDVDGSEIVNAVDLQLVIRAIFSLPTEGVRPDVNLDGHANALDLQVVILRIFGIPVDVSATVPDLEGLHRTEAAALLFQGGLTLGMVSEEISASVPYGHVIAQDPASGRTVPPGTPVNVRLSSVPPAGEMVHVPAGSFEMGDPWQEGGGDELPVHTVNLSAYAIGKYEVTNRQYADVLNWALDTLRLTDTSGDIGAYGETILGVTSSYCQINYSGGRFVVETRDGYAMDNHPVVEVTWYGAAVFCNWLSESEGLQPCYDTSTWECDFSRNGYRLPTEAQWERAAAWDPAQNRHYRYGNGSDSISASNANYDFNNPLGLSDLPYTSPVGYFPGAASPAGCLDMSGNVYEWCNDSYASDYYTSASATDPVGPEAGLYWVLRGGSWGTDSRYCRSAYRSYGTPASRNNNLGFRVVRTP